MVHALRSDATHELPTAIVETRALGADIVSGIEFHLQRCMQNGIAIFAITDGRYWHLYPIVNGVTPGAPTAICDLFNQDEDELAPMAMLRCATSPFDNASD